MFSPFQIPIFEKGYEKDPAVVAKEAIQEASRNGSDVVLVDTAGRMQVPFEFYELYLLKVSDSNFLFQLLFFLMPRGLFLYGVV